MSRDRRRPPRPVDNRKHRATHLAGDTQARDLQGSAVPSLTLHERSVGLEDNVRNLLDWLVDEELERWRREEL